MLGNGSKTCPACGTTYEKALENFYRDKHTKDGMHSRCISCETRGEKTSRVRPLKSLKIEYGVKKNYSKSTLEPFYNNNDKKTIIAPHQHKLFDIKSKGNAKTKTIKCISCNKTFPATSKYFSKEKLDRSVRSGICKPCDVQRQREFTIQNKELTAFRKKRSRAHKDGIEFNLNEDKWVNDMKRTTTCGDCNGSMNCLSENRSERTSFDKIDPTKGYIENNTRLLCVKCNSQKNDLSPDEWNAVLEIRVEKGIIKKVDPKLVRYLKTRNTLEPFFMEYECAN